MPKRKPPKPTTSDLLRSAARGGVLPGFDPFEADPPVVDSFEGKDVGIVVDLYVDRLRDPMVHEGAKMFLRGWFEAMGLGLPPDLRLSETEQQALRDDIYASYVPKGDKPKPRRPAPVTTHGNREGLDGVLRAVLDSKATSKNTYEDWQKVQPPHDKRPTWSTFQRQTRQHRKAGETAWDTAYRLAQEKRKR